MRAKWYFGTLFLLFISFGAFQEQVSIPNQEIVLEFVDSKIDKKNIAEAITEVKEKLQKVGIVNINIKKNQNGTLKISYFSNIDIDNVKKELAKENKLLINKSSKNKEENNNSYSYNLDIYELTNESDISNSDFKFVFEFKSSSDRFTTYNHYAFFKKVTQHKADKLFTSTFKASQNNPFTKDRSTCKEPEVRAGPFNFVS